MPKEHLLEHLLYRKCWIDTVQWHYEDIIRDQNIDPVAALSLKDRSMLPTRIVPIRWNILIAISLKNIKM